MKLSPIPLTPQTVPKKWGYELVICNNEEFCGKLLHFKIGSKFSAHFHKDKREVFWLQKGKLQLNTINTEDASILTQILEEGAVVEIPRLLPHQIIALEDSDMVEFSTHHEDSDSYRVMPGDSQIFTQ